ncbi:MAG: alpha-amylase family glycosyl hydrolase [Bacteroidota bacterium]
MTINKTLGLLGTLLLLCTSYTKAQVVSLFPAFASQNDTVTVTFDATQGNAALIGVSLVYAHAGVITNKSTSPSDWKYVQGNWGTDDAKVKMTSIGNNKFTLKYHIKTFYGIPANETALKLAFVFRNADGSKVGRSTDGSDIFVDLSSGGFSVLFKTPATPIVITESDSVTISASSSAAGVLTLFKNGVQYSQVTNDSSLNTKVYGNTLGIGKHRFVISAVKNSDTSTDTTYILVRPAAPNVGVIPVGIKDGINYIDDSTVTLVLYAPGKSYVYTIGDFSNWEFDNAYFMKRNPEGTRFWITLTGLQPKKEYGFQYVIGNEQLRVADAHAAKVLDPWNDGSIPATTYPNLKPYPVGQTTQIVSVLQPGQTPYNWQHASSFIRPAKEKLVIYELLIRDFIAKHDYKTLKDTLGYLKRLGINAIELMPITEFEGNESWGYNISFPMATDKYYGTAEDLKAFIDECHKQGMAVIMDMVLNHAFGQNPLVRMYFDPAAGPYGQPTANNPWFNQTDKHPYGVGYDFNHEAQPTKDYTDCVLQYWLTEFKIDGYRFDLSKGFTQKLTTDVGVWGIYDQSRIDIWKRIHNKVRTYDSSCYMILEHFADNNEEVALSNEGMMLWGNINHSFAEATMGYISTSDVNSADYKKRNWSQPNLVAYAESHDEERLMTKNIKFGNSAGSYITKDTTIALKRMEAAMCLFLPLKGPKMIWQFGELGYDISIDQNGRTGNKPILWNYYNDIRRRKIYDVVSTIANLKISDDSLSTDNYTYNGAGAVKTLQINSGTTKVSIVANFGLTASAVTVHFPAIGTWYNVFKGDSITLSSTQLNDTLAPGEYRFYSNKYISFTPTTGVEEAAQNWIGATVYPNPTGDAFSIQTGVTNTEILDVEIWSLTGQKVYNQHFQYAPEYINLNAQQLGLNKGIYIVTLKQQQSSKQFKLMIL